MSLSHKSLPVAKEWFQIGDADEFGVRRVTEPHAKGGSIWFVEGRDSCLLVDTSIGVASIRSFLDSITPKPIIAFASVGYYDHAGGLHQFDSRLIHKQDASRVQFPDRRNTVIDFYFHDSMRAVPEENFNVSAHKMVACEPTELLKDGDEIELGDRKFEVLHLPGITQGTCGLFERDTGILFTGEACVWSDEGLYDGEPSDRSADANQVSFRASI